MAAVARAIIARPVGIRGLRDGVASAITGEDGQGLMDVGGTGRCFHDDGKAAFRGGLSFWGRTIMTVTGQIMTLRPHLKILSLSSEAYSTPEHQGRYDDLSTSEWRRWRPPFLSAYSSPLFKRIASV